MRFFTPILSNSEICSATSLGVPVIKILSKSFFDISLGFDRPSDPDLGLYLSLAALKKVCSLV